MTPHYREPPSWRANRLDRGHGRSEHDRVDLLAELEARGLVQDSTDRPALAERLRARPITVYCGFDPSADSLHVGNLIGIMALRRFGLSGHRAVALVGGATGMIGDPSGRSEERNLLDAATLEANVARIGEQLGRVSGADVVDNVEWTADLGLLAFLRDVGKAVTVNQMVAKESVRARMAGSEGISFTEFSYMLLQAHDYWWLHAREGCQLQIGGSDQWGNITLGIDLVRRMTGGRVHGLTWPLLLRSDGRKFGKSESGNVWLAADRTSPYAFFQHWMQVTDTDVARFLLQLTLLPVEECAAIAAAHAARPERREGQRRLAREVTALVHGPAEASAAESASSLLFGPDLAGVPEAAWEALVAEVPTTTLPAARLDKGLDLVELLVEVGLARSRGEARRTLDQGGVYLNNKPVLGGREVCPTDLHFGRYLLLRKGKRDHRLVRTG